MHIASQPGHIENFKEIAMYQTLIEFILPSTNIYGIGPQA